MLSDKLRAASLSSRPLPEFVSSSTNRVTTAGNTVTAPSGIQNGDLLVAVGFHITNGLTITPPTGFNPLYLEGTSANTVFIATKVASSESGDYAFTWSGTAASNTIAILVYRNATRVNTAGTIARTSGSPTATLTASAITPTYEGVLLAFFANETARTVSTAPSAMTQRALQTANAPAFGLYDLNPQAASDTGTKSITWSGTGTQAALLFQVTNEPDVAPAIQLVAVATGGTTASTTLTINKPTGTAEGDLMVAGMTRSGTATWTGATGWTEVADQGTSPSLRVAYKVAGASEGSNYTFTQSGTESEVAGFILTYRNASYANAGSIGTSLTTTLIAPSVVSNASQSVLIAFAAAGSSTSTFSTPSGMTSRATSSISKPKFIACDQSVSNGDSSARTFVTNQTDGQSAILLVISPTGSL
jgi:hypothetical protein